MPDKPWKQHERNAGKLIGGARYWANAGERIDCESEGVVAQCKHVQRMSLAELEALAVECERLGAQRQKTGVVIVKRRAGHGNHTPMLVVLTEHAWRELSGRLPCDPA